MSRAAKVASVRNAETAMPLSNEQIVDWFECYQFLALEAACLDEDRPEDWLELLTPDISYEVPIRQTRRRTEDPISVDGWHMKEDLGSLRARVARPATNSAWAEDPPSRTRRG